jgi:hypothetical protein
MGDETRVDVSGGNIGSIGQGSTGTVNVSATASDPGLVADIDRRLAELRDLLERHAADLPDPGGAREDVDSAAEQLHAGRPEKMRPFLSSIASAAPGATAIAQAVREVMKLVATLLP